MNGNENKKYNILVVHNFYQQKGGEDTVFYNEVNMLKENGHNVITYTRNNNEIKAMPFYKKILLPFIYVYNFKTYFDIKKIIKDNKIEIIHIHNYWGLISQSVYYAGKKCNIPVVQTIHNFRFLCPNGLFYKNCKICEDCVSKGMISSLINKCYRNSFFQTLISVINIKFHRVTGILYKINYILLTEFSKNKFLMLNNLSNNNIIDINKVFVKPNFTIPTIFDNSIYKKKDEKYFIFVGRLNYEKGIKELFYLWKNITFKDVFLYVIGDGDLKDWCEEYIIDNKITNIKMFGSIDNESCKEYIKYSKGMIQLYNIYENFPIVILEALSYGIPTIITSNVGNASYIINDNIGIKINSNNINQFISAINKLLNTNELNKYKKNCLEEYNLKYTKIINYLTLINIYNKIYFNY